MKREQIVINTLVFLDKLRDGMKQSDLMEVVKDLGIDNVEIRREFINDFQSELKDIFEKSQILNMKIFYSVPEVIYKYNTLLDKNLEKYCKEAKIMGANNIKLNIGEVENISSKQIDQIMKISEKYDVNITIENDQTFTNGTKKYILDFLNKVSELNGRIFFTFDIGNWIFTNEDPIECAKALKDYVRYIHIKNIGKDKTSVLLNEGIIDIQKILKILPIDVPVAIEYPCKTKEIIQHEINELLSY